MTRRMNEVNFLKSKVAESEKRADEAVLILREKGLEILELEAEIKKHKENTDMQRLLEDGGFLVGGGGGGSSDKRNSQPRGKINLKDIGIGISVSTPSEEDRRKQESERRMFQRKGKLPKFPRMKSVQRVLVEEVRSTRETELRHQEMEALGRAFNFAVADGAALSEEAIQAESPHLASDKSKSRSTNTNTWEGYHDDASLKLVDLTGATKSSYSGSEAASECNHISDISHTIKMLQNKILSRLVQGEESL